MRFKRTNKDLTKTIEYQARDFTIFDGILEFTKNNYQGDRYER
jgi:hypothetical protein